LFPFSPAELFIKNPNSIQFNRKRRRKEEEKYTNAETVKHKRFWNWGREVATNKLRIKV